MGSTFSSYTAEERARLKNVLESWKLTPATFAQKMSKGRWIAARHLEYISLIITRAILAGNGRIIISMPPRHGKSQFLSKWTSAWHLERFPDRNVILASYGADLSTGFSLQVRDIYQDEENHALLSTRVRDDKAAVDAFETTKGGGMMAVGLQGAITGRGAHLFLIDDFIKGIKEALSQSQRDYIWNWFTTVAYTRLEPGATMIILATRWHSDDLIGRLLTNFPEEWTYIELPALAEADDPLGRAPGQALFPERYNEQKLLRIQRTLGSAFFGALYQQKPVDETNKLSDGGWLKIADPQVIPWDRLKLARIWDLAATEDGGDWTCGTLMGFDPHLSDCYILNVQRKQLSSAQAETLVRNTAVVDGANVTIYIEQEPGASGKALVEHYANSVLKEFKVVPVTHSRNKVVRAQPFLAAAEAGNVYLYPAKWNNPFIREMDSFPGGPNDDQIDTASIGYVQLSGKKVFTATWGRSSANVHNVVKKNSRNLRRDLAKFSMSKAPGSRVSGATFGRR